MHHPHAALTAPAHPLRQPQQQPQPQPRRPMWLASWGASACALLLAGCAASKVDHPLAYVPEDSLFVAANLEPMSDAGVQLGTSLLAPLDQALQRILALTTSDAREKTQSPSDLALLDLLVTTYEREGLAGFGISPKALYAAYEIDRRPVLRVSLADAQKFRQWIAQLEQAAEQPTPSQMLGDIEYWRITPKSRNQAGANTLAEGAGQLAEQLPTDLLNQLDAATLSGQRTDLLIAIAGEHLVIAMDLDWNSAQPVSLERLLGQQKPGTSMQHTQSLHKVTQQHGLTPYGTFWLDTAKLMPMVRLAMSDGPRGGNGGNSSDAATLSPVCEQELQQLQAKVPALVGGISAVDDKTIQYRFTIVLEPGLRDDLQTLVAPLPALDMPTPILAMGASLRLDKLATLVQTKLAQWQAAPFQCEQLLWANEALEDAPRLAQAMAPLYMIGGTSTGFYTQITHFDYARPDYDLEFAGLAVSDNPNALLAYAALLHPEIGRQSLQADGTLHRLDTPVIPNSDKPMWIGAGPHAVGMAVGESGKAELELLLQQPLIDQPPLLSLRLGGQLFEQAIAQVMEERRAEQAAASASADDTAVRDPDAAEMERLATDAVSALFHSIRHVHGDLAIGSHGIDLNRSLRIK